MPMNLGKFFHHVRNMSLWRWVGLTLYSCPVPQIVVHSMWQYHRHCADRILRQAGEIAMPMILEKYKYTRNEPGHVDLDRWLRVEDDRTAASFTLSQILVGHISRPPTWDDAVVAEACLKNYDYILFDRHRDFFLHHLANFPVDWSYVWPMPLDMYCDENPQGRFVRVFVDE